MSRALITLDSKARREQAFRLIEKAPPGTRVEFKATKRTIPQNDRMWAMLTDVARQVEWHGKKLRPDDWKILMLDALTEAAETSVPNLEGTGFVSLRRSSDLSKNEMSEMIDLIAAWGAQHGVKFGDDQENAA